MPFDNSSGRRGLLAVAHIAKAQLAIEDDDWRDLVERETGKRSCADVETPALLKLMQRLEAMGFVNKQKVQRGFKKSRKPQARLCWALWAELKQRGAIRNPSREAARALFATLAGIEGASTDPDFMDAAQLRKAVEGLKAMVARAKAEESAA
jgi:phage gp16-like protein